MYIYTAQSIHSLHNFISSLVFGSFPSDLRKRDGSVVSWGGPRFENFGGDSSRVQEQLKEVREIKATHSAFAALKAGRR